jgi:hypothetical protein
MTSLPGSSPDLGDRRVFPTPEAILEGVSAASAALSSIAP